MRLFLTEKGVLFSVLLVLLVPVIVHHVCRRRLVSSGQIMFGWCWLPGCCFQVLCRGCACFCHVLYCLFCTCIYRSYCALVCQYSGPGLFCLRYPPYEFVHVGGFQVVFRMWEHGCVCFICILLVSGMCLGELRIVFLAWWRCRFSGLLHFSFVGGCPCGSSVRLFLVLMLQFAPMVPCVLFPGSFA